MLWYGDVNRLAAQLFFCAVRYGTLAWRAAHRPRWARLNREAYCRSFLPVNLHFGKVRGEHNINLVTSQIPARNRQRFHSLVDRTCTNGLYLGVVMFTHDTSNSPGNGSGARFSRNLYHIWTG